MASSAKKPHPTGGPRPGRSWANVVANRPTRVSLLSSPQKAHDLSSLPDDLLNPNPPVIRSNAWRTGRNSGSFFLDLTSRKEGDSIINRLLLQQFSSCRGTAPHREGGRRLLEVNIDPRDGSQTFEFSSTGLLLEDGVRIIPTKALPSSSNIVKLRLFRLPFLSPADLELGLFDSLSQYGTVLDVGINTDPLSGMFMGSGYAVLETANDSDMDIFKPLTHILPFTGMDNGFQAEWENMPEFCKYCHQSDHVRANCPTARPLRLCYNCNKPGHVARQCKQSSAPSPPEVSHLPPLVSTLPPAESSSKDPSPANLNIAPAEDDIIYDVDDDSLDSVDIDEDALDSTTPCALDDDTEDPNYDMYDDHFRDHSFVDDRHIKKARISATAPPTSDNSDQSDATASRSPLTPRSHPTISDSHLDPATSLRHSDRIKQKGSVTRS